MPFSRLTKRKIQLYLSTAIVYGSCLWLFRTFSHYQKEFMPLTFRTLLYLYLAYLILSPGYYLLFGKENWTNKPFLFLRGLGKIIQKGVSFFWTKRLNDQEQNPEPDQKRDLEPELKTSQNLRQNNAESEISQTTKPKDHKKPLLEKEEKVAFLFLLVKIFYLPMMLDFFYGNFFGLISQWNRFYWYSFLFTLMFTLDTLVFSLGYAFEFRPLKNVVKSVEPTLLGWAVALVCYPPFNSLVGKYVPWGANDWADFGNPLLTIIMRIVILLLILIYVWATFALGPRSSNLTNRGIVTRFPYSLVRHPAYISKTLAWWLTLLPVINWPFALGMLFWSTIYFLRAWTEERHLKQDPDYVEYCRKVKYRFIPYLF